MARTLKLTDGTTTVDLLDNVNWGLLAEGWLQADPDQKQIRRESVLSEGNSLLTSKSKNVFEVLKLRLTGPDRNAMTTALQTLATLTKQARDFHTTVWQPLPVYLQTQVKDETNPRYALVYDVRLKNGKSFFGRGYEDATWLDDIELLVEREPYWRSAAPGTVPSTGLTLGAPQAPSGQVDATVQAVINSMESAFLTDVYNYDASVPAFSGNLVAGTNFRFFEVSASTPAVGDIVYFGSGSPFRCVALYVAEPAVTNGVFYTLEYWNGSAWTATNSAYAYSYLFTSPIPHLELIFVNAPSWATTAVNGVTAYWIRIRISAVTTWTTSPKQGAQVIYNPRAPYISIASSQIKGDAEALALLRFIAQHNFDVAGIAGALGHSLVAVGLRGRGLTDGPFIFTSRVNAGNVGNPYGWTVKYYGDFSADNDVTGPDGKRATCTFAGASASHVSFTTSLNKTIIGDFQVYLRCRQVGGAIGDVSVQLQVGHSLSRLSYNEIVYLKSGTGFEMVNLGRAHIGSRVVGAETIQGTSVLFHVQAWRTGAAATLYVYDLVLIPIDEWAMVANYRLATDFLIGGYGLDVDGGLRRQGTLVIDTNTNGTLAGWMREWESRGELPRLPPDRQMQLHFLFAYDDVNDRVKRAWSFMGGTVQLFAHNRWTHLRGSE